MFNELVCIISCHAGKIAKSLKSPRRRKLISARYFYIFLYWVHFTAKQFGCHLCHTGLNVGNSSDIHFLLNNDNFDNLFSHQNVYDGFFFPLHHVISYKPRWTSIQVSHSLIRFIITDLPSLQFSPEYPGRHSHLPPTQMLLFWHGLLSHWSAITNNQSVLWANSWIDTWFFWIMFNVI